MTYSTRFSILSALATVVVLILMAFIVNQANATVPFGYVCHCEQPDGDEPFQCQTLYIALPAVFAHVTQHDADYVGQCIEPSPSPSTSPTPTPSESPLSSEEPSPTPSDSPEPTTTPVSERSNDPGDEQDCCPGPDPVEPTPSPLTNKHSQPVSMDLREEFTTFSNTGFDFFGLL